MCSRYWIGLDCNNTVLDWIGLYCIVLHCIILYCIVLCRQTTCLFDFEPQVLALVFPLAFALLPLAFALALVAFAIDIAI